MVLIRSQAVSCIWSRHLARYSQEPAEVINILGEAGTLYNYPDLGVEKPCGDCVLVGMNAGLEYPDGRDANTKEGLWLHHVRNHYSS